MGRVKNAKQTVVQVQPRRRGWRWALAVAQRVSWVVWWALRWHHWVLVTLLVLAATLIAGRAVGLAGLLLVAIVAGGVWWQRWPVSFQRRVLWTARASWRRELVFRRRWRKAMHLMGLAVEFDGDDVIPRLGRVTSTAVTDVVEVRLPDGQQPLAWTDLVDGLAQTFGALECRVEHPKPRWLRLEFIYRRDLPPVPALPVPTRVDLDRLPIGRRADGKTWYLRLASVIHALVAGATNAGKGSVLWSIIRALAGGVRDGLVQLWVADPKGGMEFSHGPIADGGTPTCPMFTRMAVEPSEIADLLEEAVALRGARARRLAGRTRQHTPSRDEPTVVLIIDELAALTAYASDEEIKRIAKALGVLLSQGRAVGIHVVVAVQDPRKATIKVRDLIPHRIGLRMVDADHVDAALGQTAWAKGARCEEIPVEAPGCGWVFDDVTGRLVWVRASWVDNADIAAMARDYPAPTPGPGAEPVGTPAVVAVAASAPERAA